MNHSVLLSACLMTVTCTGVAVAASPVAYVYVAEEGTPTTTSPISVYAASSAGQLTQIKGSPFTQTSGLMVGTNGTHFITVDQNYTSTNPYLHSYDVSSAGVIGEEVSEVDLHPWCGADSGAKLDHTGQDVYVLDTGQCGGGLQSFTISKSGELTFKGSVTNENALTLPVISGNDKFAYPFHDTESSDSNCGILGFEALGRESSGALERISLTETDPKAPAGFQAFQDGYTTDDPTDHLASLVYFDIAPCGGQATQSQLASYTVTSKGDLVSTNTSENMPQVAAGSVYQMMLNPAGNILAVAVGTGIQFFHFNGASPITPFTGVIGTTGYISTMAWDKDNHLYALNAKSGKLHVYTATSKSVVESSGSPYEPPFCPPGVNYGCTQTLIVRSIP